MPQPEWPRRQTSSPGAMVEGDVVEHGRLAECLDDVLEGELGGDRRARRAALAPSGQAKPVLSPCGDGFGHSSPSPEHDGLEEIVLIERVLVLAKGIVVGRNRNREVGGNAAFEEARAL